MSGAHSTKPYVLYLPYNHFHELLRGVNPIVRVIILDYYPSFGVISLIFHIWLRIFSI